MIFPTVAGTNLEGQPRSLPADLEGVYNVLVIAFERSQAYDVKSWMPFLQQLCQSNPHVCYYRLATMWDFSFTQREMIRAGMRMGMRDSETRSRLITLYLDVEQFMLALGLADMRVIYVLLVDQPGEVLWTTSGRYTHPKGQALEQRIHHLANDRQAGDPATG